MNIILGTASTVGFSDELVGAIITALVSGGISIIGFIVTNISMKNNFKNELLKQRDSIALENLSTMSYEILQMTDKLLINKKLSKQDDNRFAQMINAIYAYGSEESIMLLGVLQEEGSKKEKVDILRIFSIFILLATQIKFDITGNWISPGLWFQMHFPDYEEHKEILKNINNEFVRKLNLNKELLLK